MAPGTILTTPDGANHPLRLIGAVDGNGNPITGVPFSTDTNQSYDIYDFAGYTNLNCGLAIPRFQGTLVFATADSSYIRVEANTLANGWSALFPDGSSVGGLMIITGGHAVDSDASLIADRNSNAITISGNCMIGSACTERLTDALGRNVTMTYASNASGTWTDSIAWPGPNGTVTTNVNWKAATPFQLPYYCQVSPNGNTNTAATCNLGLSPSVVSSIQLPPASGGGNSVNFLMDYNPFGTMTYTWGELHTLKLCTGASPSQCQPQWTEQYIYQFDTLAALPNSPSSSRPPGTATNPIASKTLSYVESLLGTTTPLQETTSYFITVPTNVYTYPTVSSGPTIKSSQVTYPDGSYSLIYTENLCPSNLKSRDLCVALPYKILNRDGSTTEMLWVGNSAAPGVPSGAPFNPYVQYSVETALNFTVSRVRFTQQDQNGNTTSLKEFDWVPSSAVVRDTNTGVITSVCAQGGTNCTPVRQTTSSYIASSLNYWAHGVQADIRAPASLTRGSSTLTFTYDTALAPALPANLTRLDQYDSATGGNISTLWSYIPNGHGNLQFTTDPNGNSTEITYATCGTNNSVYPFITTVAGMLQTTYGYDCNSGLLMNVTDTNNSIITSYTYDNTGRTTRVEQKKNVAGGLDRVTDIIYDDLNLVVTTRQDDGATRLVNTTYFDALGRVQSTQDGLGRQVQKAYRYGTGGASYELTSNPYSSTADPTMGWTLTTRTLSTPNSAPTAVTVTGYAGSATPSPWPGGNTTPTGTVSGTSNVLVSGNLTGCGGVATRTTDAANNSRSNCMDGLGRLSAVLEPNNVLTNYSYDTLDNLTSVSVGGTGQSRTFNYSTLSRLTSASNPETTGATPQSNGTVSYTYDANGNLRTRTDPNGTVTTILYDVLNRPTNVSYVSGGGLVAVTPTVTYSYDQASSLGAGFFGALTSVSSSASKMEYSYDGLGRIASSKQTTPNTGSGTAYLFSNYQYSLTDQLLGLTYPSGRAISYTLDAADQITGVSGTLGGTTTAYASGITYTAAGSLSSLPLHNGITENHTWNSRFQHTGMTAGTLLGLNFSYCPGGAAVCASGNTGSPFQQTIAIGGQTQAIQEYQHDSLNRLTFASEHTGGGAFTLGCPDSNSVWCRQFGYDNAGNRTVVGRSPAGSALWDAGTFNAKNQVADPNWGYDKAGNLNKSPAQTIGYDGENRQVAFCSNDPGGCPAQVGSGRTLYTYDGVGNRVQRIDQFGNATTYVYDGFGNLAAEYGGSSTVPAGTTQYVTTDGMGSTRLVMTGSQASERHDYQPFGVELDSLVDPGTGTWRTTVVGYGTDTVRQKFTGQERDNETGLDFFQARYFSGLQGRFTSPDPGNAGANPADPQSWNGYAYVSNNPLMFTDPDGLGFWSDLGGFLLNVGLNILTGGLNNFFGGAIGGAINSANSGPWNERLPIGGGMGALNTGGVFGSGNTGPFIFSYTPGIHRDMTVDAAVAAGLSYAAAFALANGVVRVDRGTQGTAPAMTHIHAMGGLVRRGVYETCAQAYSGTVSALQADMDRAATGDQEAEYRAIHRIQDSYASGHRYQPWIPGLFGLPSPAHDLGDLNRVPEPQAATRRFLTALQGRAPMGTPESYLFQPNNCH